MPGDNKPSDRSNISGIQWSV